MAITSKNDVCNLTLASLGNYGTVSDIDNPTNDKERTFAQWFDVTRQFVLKFLMPNFALDRAVVGQLVETPPFGYAYYYEYPNMCLKLLGVGNVKDKTNNYAVEKNKILHDTNYTEGMPIRFISDITDMNEWYPEAIILLSQYLAAYTCFAITQDVNKARALQAALPAQLSAASGLSAQENMPIRKSTSLFKQARYYSQPTNTDKK